MAYKESRILIFPVFSLLFAITLIKRLKLHIKIIKQYSIDPSSKLVYGLDLIQSNFGEEFLNLKLVRDII